MKKWRYNPWVDSLAPPISYGLQGRRLRNWPVWLCYARGRSGRGLGLSGYWEEVGKLGASDGRGVGLSGEMDGGGGVVRVSASMESLCQEFEDPE